jgi:hypothetical protein
VRRDTSWYPAEDRLFRHLGVGLELAQPSSKRPEQFQPARPRRAIARALLGLWRPLRHQLQCQRAAMPAAAYMLNQAVQRIAHRPKFEAEPAALG